MTITDSELIDLLKTHGIAKCKRWILTASYNVQKRKNAKNKKQSAIQLANKRLKTIDLDALRREVVKKLGRQKI